jgi:phage shock protein A
MHSDLLRVVAEQHALELQARAEVRRQVKLARQARRALRRGHRAAGPLAAVRVPDYVDGTFRTDADPANTAHREDGAPAGRNAA